MAIRGWGIARVSLGNLWWRKPPVGGFPTGGCRHRQFLCRPSGPGPSCDEPLLKQQTGCLPTTPAPEGRHHLCRGRQAPGRKKNKSSILSHRWLSPPAVPVSALRAWNKLRGTSVEATNRMFTHHTSPGGAALPHAGADRPRGGRRIRVPSSPTGG
jgi:hypothetical protein